MKLNNNGKNLDHDKMYYRYPLNISNADCRIKVLIIELKLVLFFHNNISTKCMFSLVKKAWAIMSGRKSTLHFKRKFTFLNLS